MNVRSLSPLNPCQPSGFNEVEVLGEEGKEPLGLLSCKSISTGVCRLPTVTSRVVRLDPPPYPLNLLSAAALMSCCATGDKVSRAVMRGVPACCQSEDYPYLPVGREGASSPYGTLSALLINDLRQPLTRLPTGGAFSSFIFCHIIRNS